VRFSDLLRLSLSALWQQKVRSILTTLGVIFGTFVLVASVSINRGVQETILRESQRHGELQRVQVFSTDEQKPAKEIEVKGVMSEEKRRRLRQMIERREEPRATVSVRVGLTPERLEQLRKLDHVTSVMPVTDLGVRVTLRGQRADALAVGFAADSKLLQETMLVGDIPTAPDSRKVLLSEYLLYRLGVTDDADVPKVIGQTLRVEFHRESPPTYALLGLFNASQRRLDPNDQDLVAKVIKELPPALAKLDLTPEERTRLQKLLEPPPETPKRPSTTPLSEEFEIAGVFRAVLPGYRRGPLDWWAYEGDLLLPTQTAQRIFFHSQLARENGAHQAIVQVDSLDNVKAVAQEIKGMKLQTNTLIEFIEREQFIYVLIFGAMTCVAAVALLVAALGITNTMLISILERTREVGIMKAVGARDRHIQLIFLVEGALIGIIGGLIGLAVSWAASYPGDAYVRGMVQRQMNIRLQESVFAFPWWLLVGAPLFACLVTTLAAVYPAWRAARVNPITALRHE
jgi:putative ABC transport system permease protein